MKAASDAAVPVSRYLLKLGNLAEKYSSVEQAEAKVARVTAMAAVTGPGGAKGKKWRQKSGKTAAGKGTQQTGAPPQEDRVCRHWQHGDCWRGSTCRFLHTGSECGGVKEGRKGGEGSPGVDNRSLKVSKLNPKHKNSTALEVSSNGVKVASGRQMQGRSSRLAGANQCAVNVL
jgi:hypothetical protein